ncbi:MAG: deoxyribodipyrimidine photo-lyase [Candidatus Omnitrophica bacterium]|nr:deoxyribodipyrimidine photo-lyase [Candidatus Omnitrophota bacterium]
MLECLNDIRVMPLTKTGHEKGPVVYWMSRDQRVRDNWALIYAQKAAFELKAQLFVVFTLSPTFLDATIRQYDFMLRGLMEVDEALRAKNISFVLLVGDPVEELTGFFKRTKPGLLITDFDPLRIKREWKNRLKRQIHIPIYEVDAHNIVPCWHASSKQEFGAYTIRPKIKRMLAEFLTDIPSLKTHPFRTKKMVAKIDWRKICRGLKVNDDVLRVYWIEPGSKAAKSVLDTFIKAKLDDYDVKRNDPTLEGTSDLSPYLHFGQISAQRVALCVLKASGKKVSKEAFLEELIVRRELSDNFCYYNSKYDSFEGLPHWAQKTINDHRQDVREYTYSLKKLEQAETHDQLWNAAQREMVNKGKMHGYMRMYWGKKVLEWMRSPEEAIATAIYLNDTYELDGRDSNGYVGVLWSLGGLHDRAWGERKVFGKIRYMSYNGCKAKFDIEKYIKANS